MENALDIIRKIDEQHDTGLNDDLLLSSKKDLFLVKGSLSLVVGRPSMGKTALALNIVNRYLLSGESVCYVNLGGSESDLVNRYCKMFANRGDLNELFIESRAFNQMSARELIDCIQKSTKRFGLIVIDYIQLLGLDQIQWLYDAFPNSAVLILCQAGRSCDERDDHRVRIEDIQSWNAIEPYLLKALSIYRSDYYDNEAEEQSNLMEILYLKGFAQNQYKILNCNREFVLSLYGG